MKTIDRYVLAVSERLPEDIREDIKKELYANIEDMMPENPSEDDIRIVLEKLGDPVKLANEYKGTKRYLIGPDMYDSYISVLKLVTGIVALVVAIVALLGEVVNPSSSDGLIGMSVDIIANTIGGAIEGAIQGFMWVTLTFVILERTGVNEGKLPFIKKKWSVNDLREVPVSNGRKISRVETAIEMFFTMLFLIVLYFQPKSIGIYGSGDNGIKIIAPLIRVERLNHYMPIIIIIAFLSFVIQIWKFISMKWDLPLAIANVIDNIVVCALIVVMIGDTSLINYNFIPSLGDLINIPLIKINSIWGTGAGIFVAVIVIICLWDCISGFIKCKK